VKIGELDLGERPLLLAPMEDVTDLSFRILCKGFGADMVYTEFVSSDALIRDSEKSLRKLEIEPLERPAGIQIYGNIPEAMVDAAQIAESRHPEVIDINFGCPVRKIAGRGAGSGMMRNVPLMVEITKKVVEAVHTPVTVKTRLGYDETCINIEDIAPRLQDVGIKALTIHGRTKSQMYKGEADWEPIGRIASNPDIHIPIIGNGDINSAEKAKRVFDTYNVSGIMIGRATYGHPWIFREIKHYLKTGEILPAPTTAERVDIAKRHLALSVKYKGERTGVLEMRRHLSCYFKGFPNFKEMRMKLVTEPTAEGLSTVLDEVLDRYGAWDATTLTPAAVYDKEVTTSQSEEK